MAIDYACGKTRLMDIQLHAVRSLKSGRLCVTGLTVDGQLVIPSRPFWDNLFRRFGLDNDWANRKSDARRFEWLAVHFADYEIPYRIEWDESGHAVLYPRPHQKMRRPKRRGASGTRLAGDVVLTTRRSCHTYHDAATADQHSSDGAAQGMETRQFRGSTRLGQLASHSAAQLGRSRFGRCYENRR